MKIRCEICGCKYEEYLDHCPNCLATNKPHYEDYEEVRTIAQLKRWYKDRNLPPQEVTRFFIGVDYKEPKAFGIYRDEETGAYIVYKNKADGTRAIRYEGYDEASAVYELHEKLKEEILNQKRLNALRASNDSSDPDDSYSDYSSDPYSIKNWTSNSPGDSTKVDRFHAGVLGFIIIVIILTFFSIRGDYGGGSGSNNSYYDNSYYNHHSNSRSNNDYNWNNSNSWDSGGTDWNSDW